eukprot:jgi/Bigna1/58731/fgenesh1_kg.1_\
MLSAAYRWVKNTLPKTQTAWLKVMWTVGLFVGGSLAIYNFEDVRVAMIGEDTAAAEGKSDKPKTLPPPM